MEPTLRAWAEQGDETEAWKSRVELFEDVIPIWDAFSKLHKRRFGGMGATRIMFSEITHCLDLSGIVSQDERTYYFRCIDAMDDLWWDWKNDQDDEKGGK